MACLPRPFKALIAMLREELTALRNVGSEQVNAMRDGEKAASKDQEIERAITAVQTPEVDRTHERTYREKNYTVQVILTVVTGLAFLAAAVYAGIAARQACIMQQTYSEIQKQTTLLRNQLIGTQAAIINLAPASWNGEQSMQLWAVNIVNRGSLIGSVSLTAKIQKKTPAGQVIGEPIPAEISDERIKKVEGSDIATLEKYCRGDFPNLTMGTQ